MPEELRRSPCGGVRLGDEGRLVRLSGWGHARRDHGGLYFFDLRDRSGMCQVVAEPPGGAPPPQRTDVFKVAADLGSEYVVSVTGKVRPRPAGSDNPNMPTGAVEVEATEIRVLSAAKPPPFPHTTFSVWKSNTLTRRSPAFSLTEGS